MLNSAIQVVKILQDKGYQAVFAGGCVRDMLLGVTPKDYDIATSARPDDIERLFEHTVAVGKSFGVITVIYNNFSFEVATFRSEGEYTDGRHPDNIIYTDSMEEDAKRRDLTINGMFFDPIIDKLYDFVGGQADIKLKRIKLIGNSTKRINEDYLRMLRVVRFACRFNFYIAPDTADAISTNSFRIKEVSPERIISEILKMLQTNDPARALFLLYTLDLLSHTIPELEYLIDCKQDSLYHPEGDVWQHTLNLLKNISKECKDPIVLLACLLHDIGKPDCTIIEVNGKITSKKHEYIGAQKAKEILTRFKCSNEIIDTVSSIIHDHMRIKRVQQMKKSKVIKLICKSYFDRLLLVSYYDSLAGSGNIDWYNWLVEKKDEYFKEGMKPELPKCFIDGNDLIEMGFKPGPIFKTILNKILNLQLEDKILNKELALSYVRSKNWNEK